MSAPPTVEVFACPECGSRVLDAWYLDPTRYPGVEVFPSPEDGSPTLEFSETMPEVGEGGELDDFTCPDCGTVGIALDDLVPVTSDGRLLRRVLDREAALQMLGDERSGDLDAALRDHFGFTDAEAPRWQP